MSKSRCTPENMGPKCCGTFGRLVVASDTEAMRADKISLEHGRNENADTPERVYYPIPVKIDLQAGMAMPTHLRQHPESIVRVRNAVFPELRTQQ